MKKNKLYTVNRYNRPAFMPHADYTTYDLGGIINGVTDKLGGVFGGNKLIANGAPNLGGSLLGAAGSFLGGAANKIISGGYNSGVGNAVANLGGKAGSLISNFNPALGSVVSFGTGVIGGGLNALIGTKVDEKKLAAVNADISRGNNFVSKAGTFEDIKGPAAFMTDTNVYSGGILRDMSGKNNELAQQLFGAKEFAERSVDNNINNIWGDMVSNAQSKYSAFGGPLDSYSGALGLMQNDKYIDAINNRSDAIMGKNNTLSNPQNYFGDGGGIHIKKANEGKFTAQANKAGMGVQEYASHVLANKEDYPAATVKRANFAHVFGGRNYAFGGELGTNGTDWTNGLLYVDNGGTHEKNPLGGIPVGFDQNGTPNLVEEGETIWNDYVFSDRIKVPKAMFHTLGLGGAMKKNRLTFADASKKLAKESEQRPNDPISMAGLEASLSKLAAVQEAERMKKQMRESVGLENMAAYGGPVNRFEGGGALEWLKEHYPNQKNLDLIADAMEKMVTTNVRSRQFAEGKNRHNDTKDSDYALAFRNITRGQGNILSPDGQKLYTGDAERGREHFNYLKSLGLPNDTAFELAFPQIDERLNDINSPTHNIGLYREMQNRRSQLYNELITAPNRQRVIDSINGVEQSNNTPTIEGVLAQAEAANSPEATNPIVQDVLQQEAARNGAPPAQQGITAGNISSGTGYTGTLGVRGNGNTGVVGTENGINLGTWRTNDNHWDKYTRPGLEAYLSRLEERYNAAETPEEKRAIASEAMNEFNNLQQSYYQNIAPGIGATTSARNNAVSEHQTMFNNMQGNYGFTNIADDINLPAGHSTGDVASKNWVDGYNGPRTWLRNFGSTEYGDNNYYQDLATRFSNMGLRYAPNQNWTYGNNTLYGLSMADEGTNDVANPYGVQTPDTPAAEGEVSKVPADAVNGEPRTTTEGGNEVTIKSNEKRPLLDARLRDAPVIGGAIGVFGDLLGLTNKPDYTYADKLEAAADAAGYAPQVGYKPIGEYMRYTPFDRLFYANQLQANARGTDRMLANTSSPARNAALLANAQNTNNALGNLYRQGDESNLAQYQQMKNFNIKSPMFNSQMGLEAEIANARYGQAAKQYKLSGLGQAMAARNAIDQTVGAARSANLTNFFNSLGNIGRENFIFNQINQDPTRSYIYQTPINGGWGYVPKFMEDAYQKDVESAAQRMLEEERKKNAEAQKTTQSASGAYGGKLKRNKK